MNLVAGMKCSAYCGLAWKRSEWLSARLRLGHASNCSRALKRFRESGGQDVMDFKRRMIQGKGRGLRW